MQERRPAIRIELPGLSDAFRTDSGCHASVGKNLAGGVPEIFNYSFFTKKGERAPRPPCVTRNPRLTFRD